MSILIEAMIFPSDALRAEVEALAGAFEPAWHTKLNAEAGVPAWFLARKDDVLIGFLTVFAPVAENAEVSAFVHPEHRGEGVFTALLADAMRIWTGMRRWLLVTDRSSPEAVAVSRRLGTLAFTESTLALEAAVRPPFHGLPEGLTLVDAHAEDVEDAVEVLDRANDETGGHREFLYQVVADPERRLVILRDGERTVGAGGLHLGRSTGLFALAIDPEHQGKGWGRALVLGLLDLGAARADEFVIDVDSTNARAEKLYRSVGFTDRQITDYYEISGETR